MHLVSEVTGQLKPGTLAIAALKATLPAGTVSGARKYVPSNVFMKWNPRDVGYMLGQLAIYHKIIKWILLLLFEQ